MSRRSSTPKGYWKPLPGRALMPAIYCKLEVQLEQPKADFGKEGDSQKFGEEMRRLVNALLVDEFGAAHVEVFLTDYGRKFARQTQTRDKS